MKGTTGSQGAKNILDKFYTKDATVEDCLSNLNLNEYDCIIEPSAGNGSFSSRIPNVHAFDIAPEDDGIEYANWLTLDKSVFKKYTNILVIGNPPFGKQGALAYKFLKESMSFANSVAFILPKSFKKDSTKNRIPRNFFLTFEKDLPEESFTLNGREYAVPCVFQIWVKSKNKKRILQKTSFRTDLFEFTSRERADFRIQRVGGNAGKAFKDVSSCSRQSNYFIKNTSNFDTDCLIQAVNDSDFPTISDTVGPKSLSKGELIRQVEKEILRRTD